MVFMYFQVLVNEFQEFDIRFGFSALKLPGPASELTWFDVKRLPKA